SAVSNKAAESGYEGKRIAHVYRQSKTTPQTTSFDRLYGAINKVRDEFLGCFRIIKHAMTANSNYPILSVVVVGTFGILECTQAMTTIHHSTSETLIYLKSKCKSFSKSSNWNISLKFVQMLLKISTCRQMDTLLCFAFAENTSQTAMYAKNLVHLILAKP
ncbi:6859_t:CDS:2, partial [Funneliformis caledonium]